MKDEIKEILDINIGDDREAYIDYIDKDGKRKNYEYIEAEDLLDYITNLQEENEMMRKLIDEGVENSYKKLKYLQEENERLKKENQDFVVEQNALAYYLVKKGLSFEDIVKIINDFKNEQGKSDK